jgi:hypothetical protein
MNNRRVLAVASFSPPLSASDLQLELDQPDTLTPVKDDPSFAADIRRSSSSCALSGCHAAGSAQGGSCWPRDKLREPVNISSTGDPAILPGDVANSSSQDRGNQTSGSCPRGPAG